MTKAGPTGDGVISKEQRGLAQITELKTEHYRQCVSVFDWILRGKNVIRGILGAIGELEHGLYCSLTNYFLNSIMMCCG